MAEPTVDFFRLLPAEIDGWKKAEPPELFDGKGLFKYIDGGAELYLSYGFKGLTAIRYLKGADAEIKLDVFDMGRASDAFGVFCHGRESLGNQLGQGSEYAAGLLNFWKDRYYVSLLGYPETAEKRQVLFKLGEAVAKLIPQAGAIPALVGALPRDGLRPESVKYFRHHVWLNTFYYLADENLLQIGQDTEAVLAKYQKSAGKHFLVLVRYPDIAKAAEAERSFLKGYLPDASAGTKQLEDGRWTGIRRSGSLIALVLDAASKPVVEQALAGAIDPKKEAP